MTIFDIITNITTLKKKTDISVEEERDRQDDRVRTACRAYEHAKRGTGVLG